MDFQDAIEAVGKTVDAIGVAVMVAGFVELAFMVAQWMGMGRLFSALGVSYG